MSDHYLCAPDMMLGLWDYSRETPSSQGRGNSGAANQTLPHLGFQALPGMGFRHLLHIFLSTWWDSFCPKPTFFPVLLPLLPSWDSCGCILHCCSWAWELIRLCFIWWKCTATNPHHGLMQDNTCERGTHVFQGFRGSQMFHINNFMVSQCLFSVISLQSTHTAVILIWCWLKHS